MFFVIQPFSYFFPNKSAWKNVCSFQSKMSLYKFGDCMNLLNLFSTCQEELPIDWKHYLAVNSAWMQWGLKWDCRKVYRESRGEVNRHTGGKGKPKGKSEGLLPVQKRRQPCSMALCCSRVHEGVAKMLMKCWTRGTMIIRWKPHVWDFVVYFESLFCPRLHV